MDESGREVGELLVGWDPRRRAALEDVWKQFERAAGDKSLSDELIDERHGISTAEDAWLAG